MNRLASAIVAAVLVVVATAGCGGDDEDEAAAGGDGIDETTQVEEGGNSDPFAVRSIELELEEPGKGQRGVVTLTAVDPETTYVLIRVFDAPDGRQAAHLHQGTCGDPGEITHELERLDAGRSATTVRDPLESIVEAGVNVAVHESISAASDHVVCEFVTDEMREAE